MLTLPIAIQHSRVGILSQAIRQEEEIKEFKWVKKTVKISLFADDMIQCLKDPKTPRYHKQLQQCSRIQNQLTKISSLSIYQQ
jgi:hypothetical protein